MDIRSDSYGPLVSLTRLALLAALRPREMVVVLPVRSEWRSR